MDVTYRYEAVIIGNDLASLFAGYVLKKNRMRFAILDASDQVLQKIKQTEHFLYEISEENKKLTKEQYRALLAQVGISEEKNSDMEEGMDRFAVLLKEELKEELQSCKTITDVVYSAVSSEAEAFKEDDTVSEESFVLFQCDDQMIDADVVICQKDILLAGIWAQAIIEEKQRRMEESMRRLRIRSGKRNHRKMVYVTHSRSWFYAREAVTQFAVQQEVAPINPFMNYGFYLNGIADRDEVTECCHQMIRTADELWVFGPVSEAILTDIAVAVMEGREVRFFSISENANDIHELEMEDIIFEREVHAGQIRKSDLLDFVRSTAPRKLGYVQMSLFD